MQEQYTARDIENLLSAQRDDAQARHLMRFFKTAPGQYGAGDLFLGLKVPQTRTIVKEIKGKVADAEIEKLLYSPWHELRLCGFLLLVEEMKVNLPRLKDTSDESKSKRRHEIAQLYLRHARQANNWDLVDLSCQYILGPYIRFNNPESPVPDYKILLDLADSDNLWEQRIAIVTTLDFIRAGILSPTLALSDKLMNHRHDLIHKAIGWTLREVGKAHLPSLLAYLEKNYMHLPRTSLRYAIERLPPPERKAWLTRK